MGTDEQKVLLEKLFGAVRKDDARAFSGVVDVHIQYLSVRFGRFPLLSLCYLFRSKRILKKYKKVLEEAEDYVQVDEPIEAYKAFKVVACTKLRLYPATCVIQPQSMAAIVPRKKMSHKTKTILRISLASLLVVVVLGSLGGWWIKTNAANNAKLGTESKPIKIGSASALASVKEGKYYSLSKNITLPSDFNIQTFAANLDGKGRTINAGYARPFANEVTGTISNLTYSLGTFTKTIVSDFGFLTLKNSGTITGVTVTLDAALDGSFDFAAQQSAEPLVGVIAYENDGDIVNCTIQGTIIAHVVDIAGIALRNNSAGKIVECKNNASITQTSDAFGWHPFAAGIAGINTGEIKDCVNNGNIKTDMTVSGTVTESGDFIQFAFSAGIVYYNTLYNTGTETLAGRVIGCVSFGKISVRGQDFADIHSAGIAAANNGIVTNNGSFGEVSATGGMQTYVFIGGTVGFTSYGEITNNFSVAEIVCETQEENVAEWAFAGGIVGIGTYLVQNIFYGVFTTSMTTNHYLTQTSTEYGVAAWRNNNMSPDQLFKRNAEHTGTVPHANAEDIKELFPNSFIK